MTDAPAKRRTTKSPKRASKAQDAPAARRNGQAFRIEDRFDVHPRRSQVVGEVHARPFHEQQTPTHIFRFAFMTTTEQAAAHRQAVEQLLVDRSLPPMPETSWRAMFCSPHGPTERPRMCHTSASTTSASFRNTGGVASGGRC